MLYATQRTNKHKRYHFVRGELRSLGPVFDAKRPTSEMAQGMGNTTEMLQCAIHHRKPESRTATAVAKVPSLPRRRGVAPERAGTGNGEGGTAMCMKVYEVKSSVVRIEQRRTNQMTQFCAKESLDDAAGVLQVASKHVRRRIRISERGMWKEASIVAARRAI